ncbi:MAG: DNA polymerase III subunit delta [Planctomycetota bacterium]|jgi:DNA polymerase-3 subunit delta
MREENIKKAGKDELIYVVACKDEPLRNSQCDELIDELLEPEQRTLGLLSLDSSEVNTLEVFDELRTLPFFSDKRVVLIKHAEKFISGNRELLEKYFENPSTTGILILSVGNWDSRTRLAKKLPSVGRLITGAILGGQKLVQKLASYTQDAHGKKLGRNEAYFLVDLVGDSLPQLYNEIDKLALYAQDEKRITAEHIEQLTGHNRLFNSFNVIDSCLDGNAIKAVDQLRNMFADDKSSEYTALGAFAYHFRRLFEAKTMMQKGMSPEKIAGILRVWRGKDSFFGHLRKLQLETISGYLQSLAATDYAIKTGQTKPRAAIERLVLSLVSK